MVVSDADGLKWTKELPKVAGYYWLKRKPLANWMIYFPKIVNIRPFFGVGNWRGTEEERIYAGLQVEHTVSERRKGTALEMQTVREFAQEGDLWIGPIEEPYFKMEDILNMTEKDLRIIIKEELTKVITASEKKDLYLPCPFCGSPAIDEPSATRECISCSNNDCFLRKARVTKNQWNPRA